MVEIFWPFPEDKIVLVKRNLRFRMLNCNWGAQGTQKIGGLFPLEYGYSINLASDNRRYGR